MLATLETYRGSTNRGDFYAVLVVKQRENGSFRSLFQPTSRKCLSSNELFWRRMKSRYHGNLLESPLCRKASQIRQTKSDSGLLSALKSQFTIFRSSISAKECEAGSQISWILP
jgi:hypothetical protein